MARVDREKLGTHSRRQDQRQHVDALRDRGGSPRLGQLAYPSLHRCYRKGFGGVRLEDLVLVGEDGAELLTDFPYDL